MTDTSLISAPTTHEDYLESSSFSSPSSGSDSSSPPMQEDTTTALPRAEFTFRSAIDHLDHLTVPSNFNTSNLGASTTHTTPTNTKKNATPSTTTTPTNNDTPTKTNSDRKGAAQPNSNGNDSNSDNSEVPVVKSSPTTSSRVSAKRAEQNRQAQKAFRERRQKYVKELEERLEKMEQESKMNANLVHENEVLKKTIVQLTAENELLRTTLSQSMNIPIGIPKIPPPNAVHINGTYIKEEPIVPSVPEPSSTLLNANGSPNNSSPGSVSSEFVDFSPNPFKNTDVQLPAATISRTTSNSFPGTWSLREPDDNLFSLNNSEFDDFLISGSSNFNSFLPTVDASLSVVPAVDSIAGELQQHKRNLKEANIYSDALPPQIPILWAKDPNGKLLDYQAELCELLRQTHCKDKNPELAHGRKFKKNL